MSKKSKRKVNDRHRGSRRSAEPPAFSHSGDEPHLIREVMRASQALLAVFSREVGIPASRLALLRLLAIAHPSGLGVMELAREQGVNPAAVTRQVQDLERRRLVIRKPDLRDARRAILRLTAKGLRAFQELHERGHAFERSLRSAISDRDIATAARVLIQLRSALEELH